MDHRHLSFLGALLAFAGVLFAMLLESQGYAPCPLCLIQRWALGIVGLCLLLRFFIGARQSLWRQGLSALALFFSLAGFAVGLRQLYLQYLAPPAKIPQCFGDVEAIFHHVPFWQAVQTLLKGTSDCALIDWQWLGLSLAAYASMLFLLLSVLIVMTLKNS